MNVFHPTTKQSIIVSLSSFLLLTFFVLMVDPGSLSLPVFLLPFLLIFLFFYYGFRAVFSKFMKLKKITSAVASFYFALFPTTVLVVSSINQLSVSDVVIVGLLMFGSFLYLRYADFI
ncbi:hypothetical protein BH23PAT2_BH23PAT2_07090 [soil metagenome]